MEKTIIDSMNKSSRNKTIKINKEEISNLKKHLIYDAPYTLDKIINKTICGDSIEIMNSLPKGFVDLLIVDPPYNLNKVYSNSTFKKMSRGNYEGWLESWIKLIQPLLKPNATIYICCDWSSSPYIFNVASKYFKALNRISWEREKGRGAEKNWKNCCEDIWYFSNGNSPTFNVDAVKIKRRVVAPYKSNGIPKGWVATKDGNFRFTSPSNFWTDITVPFWSMSENTSHPTQKPEKLLAKLILASSNRGDIVFDPFLGSGTTSVVANKLDRKFLGIEAEEEYCLLAQKRINASHTSTKIQGYENGIFLERNTMQLQLKKGKINGKVCISL